MTATERKGMRGGASKLRSLIRAGRMLAALASTGIGCICLLLVALMICRGDVWAYIIYAEKPVPHFLGGVGALFLGYVFFRGSDNTGRDWLRFAARAVMLAFSFSLALVVGEVGLRAYYARLQSANSMEHFKLARREGKPMQIRSSHPLALIIEPSEDPKLVYELQPGLDLEFGHRRVRTNRAGMREDLEYAVPRAPGSVRIVGVGDSGMFGWNVEQGENYLDVLESRLNARKDGTRYDVINLAVPGYNTQLEVEALRSKGLQYKPDVVVVGWCENDYGLPFFLLEKENYRRRDVSFLYNLLFKRGAPQAHTQVAPGVTIADRREYNVEQVAPEVSTGTDVAGVRAALKELNALGRQEGFHVLVFGPMKPTIRDLCRETGTPFTSTYDLIPGTNYPSDYLIYFMHPSKDGHRVLGEYLEKDLEQRGWLAPGERDPLKSAGEAGHG